MFFCISEAHIYQFLMSLLGLIFWLKSIQIRIIFFLHWVFYLMLRFWFFFVIIYRQVKVFVIRGGLLYDKVTSTARNNFWSLVTFYRFTWIFWNQYKHCSYMQYLVRPQFVDTLFIIRLRPNMSMHRAVINNY